MKFSRRGGALLILACLVGYSVSSLAYPVRWTLDNFLFGDGGRAQGSFVYDASMGFSEVAIATSGGSRAGAIYQDLFSGPEPFSQDFSEGLPVTVRCRTKRPSRRS